MVRNIDDRIGYKIGMVAHLFHNKSNEKLAQYDMTVSQARVLYILVEQGSKTQAELQQQLYVKASTMNGIVESLLNKHLIEKRDCTSDKRSKIISVTDKGKELDHRIWNDMESTEGDALAGFSPEEQALLKLWLNKLKTNLCNMKEGDK